MKLSRQEAAAIVAKRSALPIGKNTREHKKHTSDTGGGVERIYPKDEQKLQQCLTSYGRSLKREEVLRKMSRGDVSRWLEIAANIESENSKTKKEYSQFRKHLVEIERVRRMSV